MARIKIEDLPVAETLTPEQEELIEGAGLRSFKPTFEALEARQMMDAGMSPMLQTMLTQSPGPVGQHHNPDLVRELAPAAATPIDRMSASLVGQGGQNPLAPRLMQTQLGTPAGQVDVPKMVADQASQKFNEVMGPNRFLNPWMLQRVESTQQWWRDDAHTEIGVRLNFTYGFSKDGNHGYIDLQFKKDSVFGGSAGWKFDKVDNLDWKGIFPGPRNALRDRTREVYNGWSARVTLYDEGRVVQTLAQQVESVCHSKGLFTNTPLPFDGYEAKAGGLRIWVKLPDSRLELNFEYQGQRGQVDVFKLQSVSRWQWMGSWWQNIDLGANVASALKEAEYRVYHEVDDLKKFDGTHFAEQALKTILDKANASSSKFGNGHRLTDVDGSIARVEPRDDGFHVVFRLHTRVKYWDNSIPDQHHVYREQDVDVRVGVTMKFAGEINGLKRYSYTCASADHEYDNQMPIPTSLSYEAVFGLSDAALKQGFQNWSNSAVPQAALPQAHLGLGHQGLPQGVNAPQGLAGRTIDQSVADQLHVGVDRDLGGALANP
jgi:hypothetical protein